MPECCMPVNTIAMPCSLRCDHTVVHAAAGLNHGGDARCGSLVDAVAEREEGIRGHDRTDDGKAGVLGFMPAIRAELMRLI